MKKKFKVKKAFTYIYKYFIIFSVLYSNNKKKKERLIKNYKSKYVNK